MHVGQSGVLPYGKRGQWVRRSAKAWGFIVGTGPELVLLDACRTIRSYRLTRKERALGPVRCKTQGFVMDRTLVLSNWLSVSGLALTSLQAPLVSSVMPPSAMFVRTS